MPLSTIKNKYLSKRVAFGKTAAPLYKRGEDIDELAIIALESGNKNLIELFETLPDLAVLKKARTEAALRKSEPVDKSKEDPNKERKEQKPFIEQNKEDPNKKNKQSN